MSISNPFGKECASVTRAYVNICGYYLCRRTLLDIMQEQGENTVEKENIFMMSFKGERGENNFSSSTVEVSPYISSELPECKDYINRFYSEEGIPGKE